MALATVLFAMPRPCRATDEDDEPVRHALLIGCNVYPHLFGENLKGPVNDVHLFADLLKNRFRVKERNIVRLVSGADSPLRRPLRENIEREFIQLAKRAERGDQVMILMAGHGSQVPADDDPDDIEPDDLDEVYLPADVTYWNEKTHRVDNAISDDEIRAWLDAIRAKGAFVWFVADCCHSGTNTRGLASARWRHVDPHDLVPSDVLEAARTDTRSGPDVAEPDPLLARSSGPGGLIAISAARSRETTPEGRFPSTGGEIRGLLSYHLVRILGSADAAITYRELMERVVRAYRSSGYAYPTPVMEGDALDREVLGVRDLEQRPHILLNVDISPKTGVYEFTVNRGVLSGLGEGSILAVFPAAGEGDADTSLGHLRVKTALSNRALVEPVAWAGLDAPDRGSLQSDFRCELAYVELGVERMRIAVQTQRLSSGGEGNRGESDIVTHWEGEGPTWLEDGLAEVRLLQAESGELFTRAEDPEQADWFVRSFGEGKVALIPACGWSQDRIAGDHLVDSRSPVAPVGFTFTGDHGPKRLGKDLHTSLSRIARARALLGFGEQPATGGGRDEDVLRSIDLDLLIAGDDGQVRPLAPAPDGTLAIRSGDRVGLKWTNRSSSPIDVTVLHVDSAYGIQCVYPGQAKQEAPDQAWMQVGSGTTGPEQLVFIAVHARSEEFDSGLCRLAQPDAGVGLRNLTDPTAARLHELIAGAMNGAETREGLTPTWNDKFDIQLVPWEVMP